MQLLQLGLGIWVIGLGSINTFLGSAVYCTDVFGLLEIESGRKCFQRKEFLMQMECVRWALERMNNNCTISCVQLGCLNLESTFGSQQKG